MWHSCPIAYQRLFNLNLSRSLFSKACLRWLLDLVSRCKLFGLRSWALRRLLRRLLLLLPHPVIKWLCSHCAFNSEFGHLVMILSWRSSFVDYFGLKVRLLLMQLGSNLLLLYTMRHPWLWCIAETVINHLTLLCVALSRRSYTTEIGRVVMIKRLKVLSLHLYLINRGTPMIFRVYLEVN